MCVVGEASNELSRAVATQCSEVLGKEARCSRYALAFAGTGRPSKHRPPAVVIGKEKRHGSPREVLMQTLWGTAQVKDKLRITEWSTGPRKKSVGPSRTESGKVANGGEWRVSWCSRPALKNPSALHGRGRSRHLRRGPGPNHKPYLFEGLDS